MGFFGESKQDQIDNAYKKGHREGLQKGFSERNRQVVARLKELHTYHLNVHFKAQKSRNARNQNTIQTEEIIIEMLDGLISQFSTRKK